jgi:hypothetical protein
MIHHLPRLRHQRPSALICVLTVAVPVTFPGLLLLSKTAIRPSSVSLSANQWPKPFARPS